ncbi:MAG: lysylphosphatidylglycerol synthase domain-containing protein [Planctomycetota bacterium]|nr:lysylphosphatidylglycerol synthase domain-containing protein [Planctomycetota bacterium]MDA1248477.1 lysylphosphatidylglycerol synthase domain-containing protein [Planctomycetota bacterium]
MRDAKGPSATEPAAPSRVTIGRVLKWALFLIVFAFVGQKANELWQADDLSASEIEVEWLMWAAASYIVGWLPSVWFWRRMMIELGDSPGFLPTTRAYFYGHLGKYVPGKALSLVVRSSVLKSEGVPIARSAITATIETLGVMGIGLAVWLALAPVTLPDEMWQSFPGWLQVLREPWWIAPSIVAAAVVVAIPLSSKLLSLVAWKLTPGTFRNEAIQSESSSGPQPIRISKKLLLAGSAAFLATWALHGLSLGLTLKAIHGQFWQPTLWPLWSCAVAGATSVGFFALFAPGGLGIREGLLIATLQSTYGGRAAVAAAALYRVVCFASELFAAGVLYLGSKPLRPSEDVPDSAGSDSA